MYNSEKLKKGCRNILINCANLSQTNTLLIIKEDEKFGWYKKDVSEAIFDEAIKLGIKTDILKVGEPKNNSKNKLAKIINNYDCTIFFARIGDQDRFEKQSFKTKRVMSYVKNKTALISSFGTTNHLAMLEIKEAINNIMINSKEIKITCPLGTEILGKIDKSKSLENGEVSVLRFPVVVPAPIHASTFSGKVVLSNYLTPTGSKVYDPNSLQLKKDVVAILNYGKIIKFEGDHKTVKKIEKHYTRVSKLFNIEKNVVHSWHAGIHPGIKYGHSVSDNPDRWSNSIFASPSYLHFHTCGNYAPGEICWMVRNHTVKVDGKEIWKNGILQVHSFKETLNCLNKWKDLKDLFNN